MTEADKIWNYRVGPIIITKPIGTGPSLSPNDLVLPHLMMKYSDILDFLDEKSFLVAIDETWLEPRTQEAQS
jgi:hypothetical protein